LFDNGLSTTDVDYEIFFASAGVASDVFVNLFVTGTDPKTFVTDLSNTITHDGQDVDVIKTGRGNDLFTITGTVVETSITLDGQKGNDDYFFVMGGPSGGSITTNDSGPGPEVNIDRLLFDGSETKDIFGLTDTKAAYRTPPATAETEVVYSPDGSGGGIEIIRIDLMGGDDITNVQSTPATASVEASGGFGADTFNFGVSIASADLDADGFPQVPTNLNDMLGVFPIIVDGEEGDDHLFVHDDTDTGANTGLLTMADITGLGMAQGIVYKDIEELEITLGSGGDTFNVQSTNGDTDNTVIGSAGADTLHVTEKAPDASGTVAPIAGKLSIYGGHKAEALDEDDRLNVSDAGNNSGNSGILTQTTIEDLALATIHYFDIQFSSWTSFWARRPTCSRSRGRTPRPRRRCAGRPATTRSS
ncbi:MAG: hypothetical protein ACYTF9_16395, partial [Planctomycetota bacterium]